MVTDVEPRHKNLDPVMRQLKMQFSGMIRTNRMCVLVLSILLLTLAAAAHAQKVGSATNLPLPRYVSLKAAEGNVRRGPSLTHRIDWIYKRRHLPLRITAELGHWLRVEDRDGIGGWVHYSLLSGNRTVIVEHDMLTLRVRPELQSPATAALEAGVIARLGSCSAEWCRVSSGGYRGWVQKRRLWGVASDEIRQ